MLSSAAKRVDVDVRLTLNYNVTPHRWPPVKTSQAAWMIAVKNEEPQEAFDVEGLQVPLGP